MLILLTDICYIARMLLAAGVAFGCWLLLLLASISMETISNNALMLLLQNLITAITSVSSFWLYTIAQNS